MKVRWCSTKSTNLSDPSVILPVAPSRSLERTLVIRAPYDASPTSTASFFSV
jgi:hypothetical protein